MFPVRSSPTVQASLPSAHFSATSLPASRERVKLYVTAALNMNSAKTDHSLCGRAGQGGTRQFSGESQSSFGFERSGVCRNEQVIDLNGPACVEAYGPAGISDKRPDILDSVTSTGRCKIKQKGPGFAAQ
ncbi:hypothetical protein NDU88_010111 [Pleurodeles waltl]|uniref:Uncharacterized protein n=1 Tax=Pleurodeles waltl TaxID=8319 RepID=A0AAV7QZB9_PLEWA|nr:hypothetical protein NDU88_010111 [Pleurodeles waltl]